MVSTKIKNVKTLRDMCIDNANVSKDDYNVGLANGVELALAMLEKREPNLIYTQANTHTGTSENAAKEPQRGRTVASGIRRKAR